MRNYWLPTSIFVIALIAFIYLRGGFDSDVSPVVEQQQAAPVLQVEDKAEQRVTDTAESPKSEAVMNAHTEAVTPSPELPVENTQVMEPVPQPEPANYDKAAAQDISSEDVMAAEAAYEAEWKRKREAASQKLTEEQGRMEN